MNKFCTCSVRKMARRSKEEINEQAKKLNQRCQIFREGLRVLPREDDTFVEVEEEARRRCEQLEDRLRELQYERNSCPGSSDTAIDDIERLTAQLVLWKQQKPEDAVTNTATVSQLIMELEHVVRQQQALVAITRGTRLSLDQELKREEQLLKESQQMKAALEEKLKQNRTTDNASHELARKIGAMEDHYAMLTEKLKHFIQTHISLPNEEQPTKVKGKRKRQVTLDSLWKTSQENQTSPEQTIMALIEHTVQNPQDPYIEYDCDESLAQLLHRLGIIQSHPDNPRLIRMTPYHH